MVQYCTCAITMLDVEEERFHHEDNLSNKLMPK
jgi:hypothetical protein